jgi:hypothetical protein
MSVSSSSSADCDEDRCLACATDGQLDLGQRCRACCDQGPARPDRQPPTREAGAARGRLGLKPPCNAARRLFSNRGPAVLSDELVLEGQWGRQALQSAQQSQLCTRRKCSAGVVQQVRAPFVAAGRGVAAGAKRVAAALTAASPCDSVTAPAAFLSRGASLGGAREELDRLVDGSSSAVARIRRRERSLSPAARLQADCSWSHRDVGLSLTGCENQKLTWL